MSLEKEGLWFVWDGMDLCFGLRSFRTESKLNNAYPGQELLISVHADRRGIPPQNATVSGGKMALQSFTLSPRLLGDHKGHSFLHG